MNNGCISNISASFSAALATTTVKLSVRSPAIRFAKSPVLKLTANAPSSDETASADKTKPCTPNVRRFNSDRDATTSAISGLLR